MTEPNSEPHPAATEPNLLPRRLPVKGLVLVAMMTITLFFLFGMVVGAMAMKMRNGGDDRAFADSGSIDFSQTAAREVILPAGAQLVSSRIEDDRLLIEVRSQEGLQVLTIPVREAAERFTFTNATAQ